jgi:tetratricopeptide (TPR) repeat protein
MPRAFLLNRTCAFVFACTFAFFLFPSSFLLAQPRPQPSHDLSRLRDWVAAVNRHKAGTPDAEALAVASWSRQQLDVLVGDAHALLKLLPTWGKPGAPGGVSGFTPRQFKELQQIVAQEAPAGPNRLRKRGAMLHADIASLVRPADVAIVEQPPASSRSPSNVTERGSILLSDGRHQGLRIVGLHWDFGRLLLDGVTPDPSRDEMVRSWYQATAAWQVLHHQFTHAVPHLEHARAIFSKDAFILLISGGVYEMLGSPRIQEFIRTTALPGGVKIDVASERTNLRRAAAFYRQAADLDPGLTEARIRLGRLLGLQGRHDEALRELQQAGAAGGGSLLQYYTALFLGAEEEALGHADRARQAFETALRLYPLAQSPYLALSRLAWRAGDRGAALRAIRPVLTLPANEDAREDPWWQYYDGTGRDAEALLQRLGGLFQNGVGP